MRDLNDRRVIAFFFVMTVAWTVCGKAHAEQFDHDFQSWNMFAVQGHALPKLRYWTELQPRFSTTADHGAERLIARLAVGYQVTAYISLWGGYAWTPLLSPEFDDEQRFFQQFLYEQNFGDWMIVNRTRFEQRLIANASDVSLRLRTMMRAMRPIYKDLRFVVYDEVFFTLNDPGTKGPIQGFDQNRVFAGLNLKHNAWQFELGYMNNLVNRAEPTNDRMGHIAMLMVLYTVPEKKT